MIVSAIADPSIFGPVSVTDELTSREVLGLLRGILQNGVLLCDPSRQLLRDAIAEADAVSKQAGGTQRGQRIVLILQEIYKQHKKYIVSCEEAKWNASNPSTIVDQMIVLHAHLQADVVIAPVDRHANLKVGLSKPVEIVAPQNISISRYEALRIQIASPGKPIDEMNLTEVEEHIGRSVKYTSVLRIYDYRMAVGAKSAAKYRVGIQFILTIWMKWCVIGNTSSRTAELYTVGNIRTHDGLMTVADVKARLETDIVVPIKAVGTCHSIGYVMQDGRRIFHSRGFESKRRAFTIDPGFDALGSSGALRRCLLKADVAAEKHFEQCRSLPRV